MGDDDADRWTGSGDGATGAADAGSLPDRVRSAAQAVSADAEWVRIDEDQLVDYLDSLPVDQIASPTISTEELPVSTGDDEAMAAWVLTVNAVNFGSGFFPVLPKRPGLSGSKTVFAALSDHFEQNGPIPAEQLVSMDTDACCELFAQDPNGPAVELMSWFAHSWVGLGTAVAERWNGRFLGVVEEADGSAAELAGLMASVEGWTDIARHGEMEVPLFKRAQIVPAHLGMASQSLRFDDLSSLTIFADNLVPHVLRLDGVLRFEQDLVDRIEQEDLLVPGSVEEVEIRALAIHAAELMVERLIDRGVPATSMGIDQVLWARGGEPRYKARPRHRARTMAY